MNELAKALVENYQSNQGCVTREQVGDEVFNQWIALIKEISEQAKILKNDLNWSNREELNKTDESRKAYDAGRDMITLIGDINGYPLRMDSDFMVLMITYRSFKKGKKHGSTNAEFHKRIEGFFARSIVVQQAKSQEIIKQEISDRNAVRALKKSRNKQHNKQNLPQESTPLGDKEIKPNQEQKPVTPKVEEKKPETPKKLTQYKFRENDTLFVYLYADKCEEEGHLIIEMDVEFSFYGKANKRYVLKRCAHCQQFHISMAELSAMFQNYGVPRGIIVYEKGGFGENSEFNATSIFHDMGYSVSNSSGLTKAQRQEILKHAIECGVATKQQVLTFLKQRMNINGMKSGNEDAFYKWKADYDYINSLKFA